MIKYGLIEAVLIDNLTDLCDKHAPMKKFLNEKSIISISHG